MIITINTKEDSKEDIRKAISFLQTFLSDIHENSSPVSADLFNLFNDSSLKTESSKQQEIENRNNSEDEDMHTAENKDDDSHHFVDRFEVY